jgi:hypothetical protein
MIREGYNCRMEAAITSASVHAFFYQTLVVAGIINKDKTITEDIKLNFDQSTYVGHLVSHKDISDEVVLKLFDEWKAVNRVVTKLKE